MLSKVELEIHGENAAAQVASLYWSVVNQLVQQRSQKQGSVVPPLRE
ncbi:MAG: hypothetical protein ACOC7M_00495 [Chloroflexota bacterium]